LNPLNQNLQSQNPSAASAGDRNGLLAFSVYLLFWFAFFGRPLIGHFGDFRAKADVDPTLYAWYLVWWPYALVHRLNPFLTDLIWYPVGINLTWATPVPLFSYAAWPLTAHFGPIVTLNLLTLLCPPLAGWAAFLLCRYVSKSWWPALLGGYVFGFSSYILAEECTSDLHITLVFLVPLAVLTTVKAIAGDIGIRKFVFTLAAVLAAQFLTSIEVFATMTMFGAMALLIAWVIVPANIANRISNLIQPIGAAYLVALIILSPYVYWLFAFGMPHGEIFPAENFSPGIIDFLVPSQIHEVGTVSRIAGLEKYLGLRNGAYIGLPLLAIVTAYASRFWHTSVGKMLTITLIVVTLFTLGPRLHINFMGPPLFPLPGKILGFLPLIDKALPARFVMYSFLCLAVIVATWFASNSYALRVNASLAAIVVFFSMPSFTFPWVQPDNSPAFFTGEIYRAYLKPGETIAVLPFGWRGESMLWQAETNMYFRMTGGWTGLYPKEFEDWPIFHAFLFSAYLPDAADQLGAFIAHYGIDVVVVADTEPDAHAWGLLLSKYSAETNEAGGVTVYRMSSAALAPYLRVTSSMMRRRARSAAIASLIVAAARWLSSGHNLRDLDPAKALQSGSLEETWCAGEITDAATGGRIPLTDANHHWFCGIEIGGTSTGNVMIGIPGSYSDIESIVDRYRGMAQHIYFPIPNDLLSPHAIRPAGSHAAFLKMEFDRNQIAALAAQLGSPGQSK